MQVEIIKLNHTCPPALLHPDPIPSNRDREGLLLTPVRMAPTYQELAAGYHVDPVHLINDAISGVNYDHIAVGKDVDYQSICEHHMLPSLGQAHMSHIPDGKMIRPSTGTHKLALSLPDLLGRESAAAPA